eukprot:12399321-Karenia_brevis.AAC.1
MVDCLDDLDERPSLPGLPGWTTFITGMANHHCLDYLGGRSSITWTYVPGPQMASGQIGSAGP